MDPNAQQLAARQNPTPVTTSAPTNAGFFRATGDNGDAVYQVANGAINAYKLGASGTNDYNANKAALTAKGINWDSLPTQNLGDLYPQYGNKPPNFFDLSALPGSTPMLATQNQTINNGTNQVASAPNGQAAAQPIASQAQQNAPGATQTPQGTQSNNQGAGTAIQANNPALTMPANGSVVDLLNLAGSDSSYGARKQLASQYGIQGYSGTPDQNKQLADKFLAAYNANKGSPVPQSAADARNALANTDSKTPAQQDPQANFFDAIGSMNPVQKQLYDTITQTLSSVGTQQTFTQQYQDLMAQQGIPALQTELMNINNIMSGTEDDIRNEITKAGGFATDSQVQALTAARNKTLQKQATTLTQQLQLKDDYVNQIMQFSQADRADIQKQVDQKIGLTTQLSDLQDKMTNAAKDNYKTIITASGYSGLAKVLAGNPTAQANAENVLGLPQGTLSSPTMVSALSTPADKKLQFISGTANQSAGTFDPSTGKFTALGGGVGGPAGSGTETDTPLDTQSGSILAQTGLSIQAFNYLTQGTSSLSRLSASQRTAIQKEANNFLNKNGIDLSTFQSRYEALNKVVGGKVQMQSAAANQENELLGTISNMQDTISSSDLGSLKAANIAKLFATGQVNDPTTMKYATYLEQLQNELAGYNAAVRGNLSATGGPSPDQSDKADAARVIENGINSGSLSGFKDAIVASQQKMSGVLQTSVDAGNKSVWDLFGVGQNFKGSNTAAKGNMSDKDYVSKMVTKSGQTYNSLLSGAQPGEIAVAKNDGSKIVYIPADKFNSNDYTRL